KIATALGTRNRPQSLAGPHPEFVEEAIHRLDVGARRDISVVDDREREPPFVGVLRSGHAQKPSSALPSARVSHQSLSEPVFLPCPTRARNCRVGGTRR